MQEKIDKLISIIDRNVKSDKAKAYAITLLSDLVNIINNQEKEVKSLSAWKTNNDFSGIECELQKYILILIMNGYSQQLVKVIRQEAFQFAAKHKERITSYKPKDIKNIDHWLMMFELENERLPDTFDEFKNFYDNAKNKDS